jgi:hypothetical protein
MDIPPFMLRTIRFSELRTIRIAAIAPACHAALRHWTSKRFAVIAPGLCTAVLRELALPSRSRAGQTFKGTDQRHKFRLTCQETVNE